jgi:hypothetical protein
MGFHGPEFTWSNRRLGSALVRVRLDRAVANPEWFQMFPSAVVSHLVVPSSDHMGLLVNISPPPGGILKDNRSCSGLSTHGLGRMGVNKLLMMHGRLYRMGRICSS